MILLQSTGSALNQAVQLTLPNTEGLKPGSVLNLYLMNMATGGHDLVGQLTVSADGQTMTSTGTVTLGGSQGKGASVGSGHGITADSDPPTQYCLISGPAGAAGNPDTFCAGCQLLAKALASAPNDDDDTSGGATTGFSSGGTSGPSSGGSPGGGFGMLAGSGGSGGIFLSTGVMDSDAGLVTGEYFLNNQLVSYQSQGQDIGINLQYSSAQADPNPVVQYQFTTPLAGDSSSITSINAQVSIAGVVQGDATTYNTPDGLTDGETYYIPLQVNATELATGVYTYTMTVTENFGSGEDETSITSRMSGSVNVVNESSDPLGAAGAWAACNSSHSSPPTDQF